MYHALVRINGEWVSGGLHVPSNDWSSTFDSLKRAFGDDNVTYIFWEPGESLQDVRILRLKMLEEANDAKIVQQGRKAGTLPSLDEKGIPS